MNFQQSVVGLQNEGSFGCEAVALALGQPNVPECTVGFHFLLSYCSKNSFIILSSVSVFLQ